jgi:kinesin family protein 3/17
MVNGSETIITVSENLAAVMEDDGGAGGYSSHQFTFDHVYGQDCNQRKIYDITARGVVESSLQGYNATIFAYGQTGTGKTYTMEGFNSAGSVEERGIIPRAIEQIFQHIQSNVSARMRFLVRASYLQIYNEAISDLLKPERNNLAIREDKKRGVFVEGLSEWVVRSPAEIYGLMERGGAVRATGSTKMNEISSRSHAVFIIIVEQSMSVAAEEEEEGEEGRVRRQARMKQR